MESYGIPHHGTVKAAQKAARTREASSGGVVEPKTQTTICDDHKAQYFQSGYEAGKKDALDPSLTTEARITGAAAMRQEAYDRGLSAGESRALGEAADRLREWMGAAFSTPTTEAAVRVVRGESTPSLKRVITEENPLA